MSREEISQKSNRPEPEVQKIVEFLVGYDMLKQNLSGTKYRPARDLRDFMRKIEEIELEENA